MQQCRNICKHFPNFTRCGKKMYKDGIVFCSVCDGGFLGHGIMCKCCKGRVRNKKIRSPNEYKYQTLVN
ncbi:MAG: hypothetical protein ACR2F1_07980 [Nitrososphaeraceae archaeon]